MTTFTSSTPTTDHDRRRRRDRVALSMAAVMAATAVFSIGAAASFTTSVTSEPDQLVSTGTLALLLGDTGARTNRLDIAATNIVPGDTIERTVDLVNSGSIDMSTITLTTEATTSSLLDTDVDRGLQLVLESCSQPWNETALANGGFTYSCPDATGPTTVIASQPAIGDTDVSSVSATTAGATAHLRTTLTLPEGAPGSNNDLQGLTTVVEYSFSGVQRAPESR